MERINELRNQIDVIDKQMAKLFEERINLVKLIKNFEIEITGFRPVEEAIVTAGGVSIKEINPNFSP